MREEELRAQPKKLLTPIHNWTPQLGGTSRKEVELLPPILDEGVGGNPSRSSLVGVCTAPAQLQGLSRREAAIPAVAEDTKSSYPR